MERTVMQKPILEIDEILNEAIMTGVPSIIVEGVDDLSVYSALFKDLSFPTEIYPIETVKDFGEGCDQVINAIQLLESLDITSEKLKKNILGIIDKDVRDFRNEIPTSEIIFTLKYYSIESHLCTKDLIHTAIESFTSVDKSKLAPALIDGIMDDVNEKLLELYYFSLEALKAATHADYTFCFSYGNKLGNIKNPLIVQSIQEKVDALEQFSASLNLKKDLETLMKITKGKWLLEKFCDESIKSINQLTTLCNLSHIEQCKFCQKNIANKCMYRLKDGVTKVTLEHLATSLTKNNPNLSYILQRVSELKLQPRMNAAA